MRGTAVEPARPCPDHGPTGTVAGCAACHSFTQYLRSQQVEAVGTPAGEASGSEDADLRGPQHSSAQDLDAVSVSSDPGSRHIQPPPWNTPGFPAAFRAAMRADTLSLGRKAKMALPSQGVRTSFRLLLPLALETYRTVAEAHPAAFGHMIEVADVLVPLMWMPQGRMDTAQAALEVCAELNGITTGLARQLMVVSSAWPEILRRTRGGPRS